MLQTLAILAWLSLPQVQPVAGQPIKFQADHDGTNTTHYRLYINGAKTAEVPVSQLTNGSIILELPNGLPAGSYRAILSAVNVTPDGTAETKSGALDFTVSPGTGTADPALLQAINLRIETSTTEPLPEPEPEPEPEPIPTDTTCGLVFVENNRDSVLSLSRQFDTQAGDLLILFTRFPSSNTAEVSGIQGGAWQRGVRTAGSDGTRTIAADFWWSVATGGPLTATVTFSEPAALWGITKCRLAGTGAIQIVTSDAFEQAVADQSHPSAGPAGIAAQAGDVLFGGGVTQGTTGLNEAAAAGWTLNEDMGTRGLTQYRILTAPVTAERGIWFGQNIRMAVSGIMVFRRQ